MNLNDKEWSEFVIGDLFDEIKNSKAYHKMITIIMIRHYLIIMD